MGTSESLLAQLASDDAAQVASAAQGLICANLLDSQKCTAVEALVQALMNHPGHADDLKINDPGCR